MSEKILKITDVDNGFCRVNYVARNDDNQKVYYCIQNDGPPDGLNLYRCTDQPWREPSHIKKCTDWNIFEIPTGDSAIEIEIRDFLNKKLKEQGDNNGTK